MREGCGRGRPKDIIDPVLPAETPMITHAMLPRTYLLFATALLVIAPARAESLEDLIRENWQWAMEEFPQYATFTGDHRYNDRLEEVSLAAEERRREKRQHFLQRLHAIDTAALPADQQINYRLFERMLKDDLAEAEHHTYLAPINNRTGFHISFPELRREMPLKTTADYEDYLSRIRAFDQYADGHMALMREGIRQGVTTPAVILEGWQESVDAHIVQDPTVSLLYEPLKDLPATVPQDQHDRLRGEAREAISQVLVPAYERFRGFLANEYVPNCRTSIAASALPEGRDFYRSRVRKFTTLDVSPEEVHRRGVAEVERIQKEMQQIIDELEYEGDFAAFCEYLRNDSSRFARTPEELLSRCALILKKADGKLPQLFGRLPRMPYGLKEIPRYIAPKTTSAYYEPPTGDGLKAGFFFLNTYNLPSRPLYTLEALALHEAVPGHHLQLALQQEQQDLPSFRKYGGFTAFVEGWALYSERLGKEMGFYEDPYSDFGRLTMEMWRACRLVVDTGIHYQGWSRAKAIDYMQSHSAMTEHNIRAEVDRYIGWPGQALAYKTGELKIRELRAAAEERLGERFDIRAFHDVVLGSGAVSLDVLESTVLEWIDQQ